MRTFIITLKQVEFSKQMAEKCRESARKVGYKTEIETFWGVFGDEWRKHIPVSEKTLPWNLAKKTTAPIAGCFTSHYMLWKKCVELNEPILILEHDAQFDRNIPDIEFDKCVNFGAPSFFRHDCCNFMEPENGLHPLRDEIFFGHHAYAVNPDGAAMFVEEVEQGNKRLWRNDLFVNKKDFPWIQEYYPWCVNANQKWSTVNHTGLKAEHLPVVSDDNLDNASMTKEHKKFKEKHFPSFSEWGNIRIMHEDMERALNGK